PSARKMLPVTLTMLLGSSFARFRLIVQRSAPMSLFTMWLRRFGVSVAPVWACAVAASASTASAAVARVREEQRNIGLPFLFVIADARSSRRGLRTGGDPSTGRPCGGNQIRRSARTRARRARASHGTHRSPATSGPEVLDVL